MSLTSRQAPMRASSAKGLKDAVTPEKSSPAGETLTRLSDTIKLKDKQIEEMMREMSRLKSSLAVAQRTITAKQSEAEGANERATQATGETSSSAKELTMIKADKKKLEGQVNDLLRQNAKLRDQLARAADKSPGISHQMASLQSSVRAARADADSANEEARALQNLVRAKDRELDRMAKQVEEAALVLAHNGQLENMLRDVSRELEEARAENRTLANVNRTREGDIAKLSRELESTQTMLKASQAAHADTTGSLRAMTSRCSELEAEIGVLRDEMARTGAVAARVAASEVKAGSKDEGTISVLQHMEECKYLQGEIGRLKEKVKSLDQQLAVADELKEKYRTAAERAGMGGSAAVPPPSSASYNNAGDITARRSSRPFSGGSAVTRSLLFGGGKPGVVGPTAASLDFASRSSTGSKAIRASAAHSHRLSDNDTLPIDDLGDQ